MSHQIRPATLADVPLILRFIRGLATYEKLLPEVEATEERLAATLFGPRPAAECVLVLAEGRVPAGFALFFTNYSTFLARPGLYLEDLYVEPAWRGRGLGKALLLHLAGLANERGCGRMEWSVLDWNQPAIDFYESLGAVRQTAWTTCRLSGPALARHAPPAPAGGVPAEAGIAVGPPTQLTCPPMPPVPPPNQAIAELAETLGEDSARELAEMFLRSFATILQALQSTDREERKRAAHSLKSSARIVGATALSDRMAELENRLMHTPADIQPEDIKATVDDFEREAVALRAYAQQA